MTRKSLSIAAAAAVSALVTSAVLAAPIAPGDLAIYRTGTSTASATGAAIPVFIDEYTPAGVLVQSIPLPTAAGTGATANPLTAVTNSSNEGLLTLSGDGQYLAVPGFAAASGTPGVVASTAQRVVGLVNVNTNAIDTTTTFGTTAYAGGTLRSAYTVDGSTIYASGDSSGTAGGIYATALGGGSVTQISSTSTNTRAVAAIGGQLYASTASGSLRLGTVGNGLPTTSGQTFTNLPGFPITSIAPNQFVFADFDPTVAGVDTLYIADQGATTRGIRKYSLVNGNWTFNSVVSSGTTNFFGLTAIVGPNGVSLFTTTSNTTSNSAGTLSQLFGLIDSGGYNTPISGTLNVIATATTNTAFRGIALVPEPASLAALAVGGMSLLVRRRRTGVDSDQ